MKRDYDNGVKDDVKFFVGTEIEHTPAYEKKTLFVVGLQNPDKVAKLAQAMDIDHIYLGANHSFNNTNLMYWEAVILELLKRDFWVTLDFDYKYYEDNTEDRESVNFGSVLPLWRFSSEKSRKKHVTSI